MEEYERFYEVFINDRERSKNNYMIKDFFPLKTILEVLPLDSHCEEEFGEFLNNKGTPIYFGTISNDYEYVAILVKFKPTENPYLLEFLRIDEFLAKYKIIDFTV